ncbi:hypothetical protein THOM_1834 [Trachipleistophora hominis]|uniref:Uncharacterized protein n=1 Tax=Trachipleistophora hominis TaxID=72359 RepID=L7JW11_TRAHO|nr:hypothetical protein THOM_1834 [Trachipleistophora hominis]
MNTLFILNGIIPICFVCILSLVADLLNIFIGNIMAWYLIEKNWYITCSYDITKFIRHVSIDGNKITIVDQFNNKETVESEVIDETFKRFPFYNIEYRESIQALLFFRNAPCLFPDEVIFLKNKLPNINKLGFEEFTKIVIKEKHSIDDITSFSTLFGFFVYGFLDGFEIQIYKNCILVLMEGKYFFCIQIEDCCRYFGTISVEWSYPILLKIYQSSFKIVIGKTIYVGQVYDEIVNVKARKYWFNKRLSCTELEKIFASLDLESPQMHLPKAETNYLSLYTSKQEKVKEYKRVYHKNFKEMYRAC